MKYRLQKIIAASGLASRRKAELFLKEGRVKINGKIAFIGDKADPEIDKISLDDSIIDLNIKHRVILLNKPKGVICSCKDTHGRKTVINILPIEIRKGLHPVGRLDQESRGAILLTNNGELTLKLTHPKYLHKKTYHVWVKGNPSMKTIRKWQDGIYLNQSKSLNADVSILKNSINKSLLNIILKEGRNRQIRRTAEILGHPVIDLKRIAISNINISNLKEGDWKELDKSEWCHLIEINKP